MVLRLETSNDRGTNAENEKVHFKRKPVTFFPTPTNIPDNAEVWLAKVERVENTSDPYAHRCLS